MKSAPPAAPGASWSVASKFGLLPILLLAAAARVALYAVAPHIESPDTAIYIETGNSLFATGVMSSPLYMPLYPVLIHLVGSPGHDLDSNCPIHRNGLFRLSARCHDLER
jgi:hypothetical protein